PAARTRQAPARRGRAGGSDPADPPDPPARSMVLDDRSQVVDSTSFPSLGHPPHEHRPVDAGRQKRRVPVPSRKPGAGLFHRWAFNAAITQVRHSSLQARVLAETTRDLGEKEEVRYGRPDSSTYAEDVGFAPTLSRSAAANSD